ncbi:MAG: S41 family peptidase [Gemmatimonadota bacterium]|nr:S41 family peptidase [Gemmatimonadota bacterium]
MRLDISPGLRSRTMTVAAILVGSLVTGGWLIVSGTRDGETTPAEAERLFNQVLRHVSRYYVDSVDSPVLYRKAVEGMLYELEDPYTTLLAPDKLGRLNETTSGNFAGVGLQVDIRDGWLVVIAPLPGSPAERAGIQPGDRIIEIEGRSTRDWAMEEATKAFRGDAGTTLSFRIERPGLLPSIPFTLVRRALHQNAVRRVAMLPNAVGYVDLKAFSDSTTRELSRSINALLSKGMKSLVLDLRSNPGGLLDQGLGVADMFLGPGQRIVSLKGRSPGANRDYTDTTAQRWPKLPLVVLVDDRSASAAEIVAGALQDHDRAVVVGEPTYGKGSAQTIIRLGEIGGLKITTARWYTPSGRSISRQVLREDSEARPKPPQRYRTDAGRIVYGGGGISPDLIVTDSAAARQLRLFQTALGRKVGQFRDAVTDYAISLKGRGDALTPKFVVTPQMLEEVWKRMVARGVDIPRMTYDESSHVVSQLLAYDIARFVFGPEAEFRRRVAADKAIAVALELATGVTSEAGMLERASARQAAQRSAGTE